ncbi:Mannitol repressor [Burkholderia sp. YR290]|nr:Mannitol repressor [Burkholderia sp. YR290]
MEKLVWSESFAFMSGSTSEIERAWQCRFIEEVERESERGAVLTIVSFIDELLIRLLKSAFPNKTHAEKLFQEMDGCLSTIMYRTNIALALSLLRQKEFDAIKILARIRNEFAHKWDGTAFDDPTISKLITKFPAEYFIGITGSNKAKFNRIASEVVQQLLERANYAHELYKTIPSQYRDYFDLSEEERRRR